METCLHEFLDQLRALFLGQTQRLPGQRARLETRILHIKGRRRIRIAVEKAIGDLLTPLQGLVHRGVEVRWVVSSIFEFVDPFAEPVIGLDLVEGDARAEDVDQSA